MFLGHCLRAVCIAALVLSFITSQAQALPTLTIYAATSLTEAFEELAAVFLENHPEADVVLNFASSSKLAAQLMAGAPADIFASANSSQMKLVVADGRISADAAQSFASNRLMLIAPADNPGAISSIADLGSKSLLLVLAVPGTPIRDYTSAMLDSYNDDYGEDFAKRVLENLVSEESNVRLVLTRIVLGEADAGIVYQTDMTDEVRDKLIVFPISARHNQIASYPIAALNDTALPDLSIAFIDFVRSEVGQSILRGFGFCPPLISLDTAKTAPTAEASPDKPIDDSQARTANSVIPAVTAMPATPAIPIEAETEAAPCESPEAES